MKFTKKEGIILGAIFILAIAGGGIWALLEKQKTTVTEAPKQEASQQEQPVANEPAQPNNQEQVSEDVQPTIDTSDWKTYRNEEIRQTLKDIFKEDVFFDQKKGNVPFYEKSYKLSIDPWVGISFIVEEFSPGRKYFIDYEGLHSTVSLDDEIKMISSLKEGKQVAKVTGSLGAENAIVEYKKIGGRDFAVYDTFFKPGGSWTRHYMTFDSEKKILFYINVSFAFYALGSDYVSATFNQKGQYFENVTYPKEVVDYLIKLENMIAENFVSN